MLPDRRSGNGAVRSVASPSPRTPAAGGNRDVALERAAIVEFVDASHVHWTVTERDARRDPGTRGAWCLIFTCPDAVRRVWDYPPGWRDLPPAALTSLSRQR